MCSAVAALPKFELSAGANASTALVELPVLGGLGREMLFEHAASLGAEGPWQLFKKGDWLLGHSWLPMARGLEVGSLELYESLLRLLENRHLCRVWNYVPRINDSEPGGFENYRLFCRGRSIAFERHFGSRFHQKLPAASAVGSEGERLLIAFAAHERLPTHFENPMQVPAYDYPSDYGPRAPAFARATALKHADGTADVFIAGTSAIKGHLTMAPGNTLLQLEHTCENLKSICKVVGLGDELGEGCGGTRFFKVYLRESKDLEAVNRSLSVNLLRPEDRIAYLRADMCRHDLSVEIEMSVFGAMLHNS